jgi:hypothetical protein
MLWGDRKLEWTDEHKRTRCTLKVDEGGPGTVLRDFQTLLSFVQERELSVSKTYQLPPVLAENCRPHRSLLLTRITRKY